MATSEKPCGKEACCGLTVCRLCGEHTLALPLLSPRDPQQTWFPTRGLLRLYNYEPNQSLSLINDLVSVYSV